MVNDLPNNESMNNNSVNINMSAESQFLNQVIEYCEALERCNLQNVEYSKYIGSNYGEILYGAQARNFRSVIEYIQTLSAGHARANNNNA